MSPEEFATLINDRKTFAPQTDVDALAASLYAKAFKALVGGSPSIRYWSVGFRDRHIRPFINVLATHCKVLLSLDLSHNKLMVIDALEQDVTELSNSTYVALLKAQLAALYQSEASAPSEHGTCSTLSEGTQAVEPDESPLSSAEDEAFLTVHRSSAPFQEFRPKLKALQDAGFVTVDGDSFVDSQLGFGDRTLK